MKTIFVVLALLCGGCFLNRERQDQHPDQIEAAHGGQQQAKYTNDATLKLDLENLKRYNVNLSGLSYKLSYLGVVQEGAKDLVDGRTELDIKGLPANRAGDLVLEFSEKNIVILRSELKNQILRPGVNQVEMVLEDLRMADVKIRIKIGGTNNAQPNRDGERPPAIEPNAPPAAKPSPPTTSPTPAVSFAEIKDYTYAFCMACHPEAIEPGSDFWIRKSAAIKEKLESGAMPKKPFKDGFSNEIAEKMLRYAGQQAR